MQLLFFSGKGLKEKNELRKLSQQGGEQPEQDTSNVSRRYNTNTKKAF